MSRPATLIAAVRTGLVVASVAFVSATLSTASCMAERAALPLQAEMASMTPEWVLSGGSFIHLRHHCPGFLVVSFHKFGLQIGAPLACGQGIR